MGEFARKRVRLSQHRRAGLDEDVLLSVVRAFLGDINIHDLAVGSREVVVQRRELIAIISHRLNVGTEVRAVRRELGDRRFDVGQRSHRTAGGADRVTGHLAIGRGSQIHAGARERIGIAVNRHVEAAAGEQADAGEGWRDQVRLWDDLGKA